MLLIVLLSSTVMMSQGGDIVIHPRSNSKVRVSRTFQNYYQIQNDNHNWQFEKDTISIELSGGESSNSLLLNEYGFHIHSIDDIDKIELKFNGYIEGDGEIEDLKIYLTDGIKRLSKNVSGIVMKGKSWRKSVGNWSYYVDVEKEDFDKISLDSFGIFIEIKNQSTDSVKVIILNATMNITYLPLLRVCKDDFMSFFVDSISIGEGYNYKWDIPTGVIVTSTTNRYIIDLRFQAEDFEIKELSLEAQKGDEVKTGVRYFSYEDCRPSDISGILWLDSNCDSVLDSNDFRFDSISLELYEYDKLVQTTLTDSIGRYFFKEIGSGFYTIRFSNKGYTPLVGDSNSKSNWLFDEEIDLFISSEFELNPGIVMDSVNFGFVHNVNAGGVIWEDIDGDGARDSSENNYYSEINVILRNSEGIVDSLLTNTGGEYVFKNLSTGNYDICFNISDDLYFSNEKDENNCINIDLKCGEDIDNLDVGLYTKGSIAGQFWIDEDKNGQRDNVEKLLNEIEVFLFDTLGNVLQSVKSDSTGYYKFDNLDLNAYVLKTLIPDKFILTSFKVGDIAKDCDFKLENGEAYSSLFVINSGVNYENIDCGFVFKRCSVGDFVWYDKNENGLQDIDEDGINNITIRLYNESDELVSETLSNSSQDGEAGYYSFEDIEHGSYYISIELPNYCEVTTHILSDEDVNSDINPVNNTTNLFIIEPGVSIKDIDVGLIYKRASIEGMVWNDLDRNGVIETGENGIDGVGVELYNEFGILKDSKISGEAAQSGEYKFDNLERANYYVKFVIPSEYSISCNFGVDMDITDAFGEGTTDLIPIFWGEIAKGIDGGIVKKNVVIGDFVWLDSNENGLQDNGEIGVSGIEVRLKDFQGNIVKNTVTNQSGHYLFSDISQGKYTIEFDAGDNYNFTQERKNEEFGSKVIETNGIGVTEIFEIISGESRLDIDAGLLNNYAEIGDFIWIDDNSNGLQDIDEKGINGVKLSLFDESNNLYKNVITGVDGSYHFEDVLAGMYYIKIEIPDSLKAPKQSGSVFDVINSSTSIFEVEPGELITDADFGLIKKLGKIGDFVWLDKDGDGLQDVGELGINDVRIYLFDSDWNFVEQKTTQTKWGNDGYYEFEVKSGKYFIRIEYSHVYQSTIYDVGSDSKLDSDLSGENGSNTTGFFNVKSGQERIDIDCGLKYKPGTVGGRVWIDSNHDGLLQKETEVGLKGSKVEIYNKNGELFDSTITYTSNLGTGFYRFKNLTAGKYYLVFDIPEEYVPTIANSLGYNNSDITGKNGIGSTDYFEVSPGIVNYSHHAGFVHQVNNMIGDFVWIDENENGIQDIGEYGIDGYQIMLYDVDSNLIRKTFTFTNPVSGESGYYRFTNIAEGDYYLRFVNPYGYSFSKAKVGAIDSLDSDVESKYGYTGLIHVADDDILRDVDAGLKVVKVSAIGDFVWEDLNENGYQDEGEPGINDVEVELFRIKQDGTQVKVKSVRTSNNEEKDGYYIFNYLISGKYYIKVVDPQGYNLTRSFQGDSLKNCDITDGQGTGTNTTDIIYLGVFDIRDDIDIGYFKKSNAPIVKLTSFPNPGADFINLSFEINEGRVGEVFLTDVNGSIVKSLKFTVSRGQNIIDLDIHDLKYGVYNAFLLIDGERVDRKKIVKIR